MADIPERDWKLLRELAPSALERFCNQVLRSAKQIADSPGVSSHERYLKLYRMIQKEDRALAEAFNDHRRSTALWKIAEIRSLGLFSEEEFSRFSEQTRQFLAKT